MLTALLPATLLAQTQVDDDSTTPLATSSAGDVTIACEAVLDVEGTAPITVDSDSSVAIEEDVAVEADDTDGRAKHSWTTSSASTRWPSMRCATR